MLTQEDLVELHALARRGWSISAIARHVGRDRKTVRAYLRGEREPGRRRPAAPDAFAPFEPYVRARLVEDPHVCATALFDELVELGFTRSYPILTREIRRRGLRPRCAACAGTTGRPTIEIAHPPGEEIQWDWLELPGAPWGGTAYLLVGVLAHSARTRAVFAEAMDQAHLIEAMDQVLRRLGGTARAWRVDRMATVVEPATGRLRSSFAPVARHYGVAMRVCAAYRPNRKGAVEAACKFITQRFWRTMAAQTINEAQAALDRFLAGAGDARRRGQGTVGELADAEPLLALPGLPYPATVVSTRTVGRSALVSVDANAYSVPPGLEGAEVQVLRRLGASEIEIVTRSGRLLARHRAAPAGAGALRRLPEHRAALEQAVLGSLSEGRPCPRKVRRPPGEAAQAAAALLRSAHPGFGEVEVDLERYAELAGAGG